MSGASARTVLTADRLSGTAVAVAPRLLGKFVVARRGGRETALPITEVEAYHGPHDRASHGARGLTPRNEPMFGGAGVWYVYLVYGMHWMLNIVTGREGTPSAVLIRGAGDLVGPGRLTRHLEIDRRFDGKAALPAAGLWLEDRGLRVPARRIERTPRVGIDYAGPPWASKPYRFVTSIPARPERSRAPSSPAR